MAFSTQPTLLHKSSDSTLASLAANKPLFDENKKKFKKHWHPSKILKDVERRNPDFYPEPVVDVENELVPLEDGFMTRDRLVEVHGRCGNLLHAQNPFGKTADYEYYEKAVTDWMAQIMKLLNTHLIRLVDDDRFYLVNMKEKRDDQVHMYTFEKVDA
jgi:tricorn protease-like protein